MNFSIFLTLLCLGIASGAPNADLSLDAQSSLRKTTPGAESNTVKDTMGIATGEQSPRELGEDDREQSTETQSLGTAVHAPEAINLKFKIFKGLFGKIKDATQKAAMEKIAKRFGKHVLGGIKKTKKFEGTGKKIGKHILGEITKSENLGKIIKGIRKYILGRNKKQQSVIPDNSAFNELTTVEFKAEDVLTPEPEGERADPFTTEIPSSVDLGEESYVTPVMRK